MKCSKILSFFIGSCLIINLAYTKTSFLNKEADFSFISFTNIKGCNNQNAVSGCIVNITNSNSCLPSPGSITIVNNSSVTANNIQANSMDSNFINYVVQNNGCPAKLAPHAQCTISFITNAPVTFYSANVIVKGSNTASLFFDLNAYVCPPPPTTLMTSVTDLALSVSGKTEYGIGSAPGYTSSGAPRVITITNTGAYPAVNLSITQPIWPSGTTAISTCTSILAAGSSCTIMITPGSIATSNNSGAACSTAPGSAPVAGVVQATAANATGVQTNVVVLDYGCQYLGGYVFAFDDTQGCLGTQCTNSIGGKVAALSDAPTPLDFGGSGTATGAISPTQGSTNTTTIYNVLTTDHAIPATSYGAGYCYTLVTNYTGWYLPAICEMGNTSSFPEIDCAEVNQLQNIQTSLDANGAGNLTDGIYVSSTEAAGNPSTSEWDQSLGSVVTQSIEDKNISRNIRCVRIF